MAVYVPESFTSDEADILRRYFTNLDGPVFALVNLPEVVKGALFARYSRSPKSLRRLFLDEFVGDLDVSGDHSVDATVGLDRAPRPAPRTSPAGRPDTGGGIDRPDPRPHDRPAKGHELEPGDST